MSRVSIESTLTQCRNLLQLILTQRVSIYADGGIRTEGIRAERVLGALKGSQIPALVQKRSGDSSTGGSSIVEHSVIVKLPHDAPVAVGDICVITVSPDNNTMLGKHILLEDVSQSSENLILRCIGTDTSAVDRQGLL